MWAFSWCSNSLRHTCIMCADVQHPGKHQEGFSGNSWSSIKSVKLKTLEKAPWYLWTLVLLPHVVLLCSPLLFLLQRNVSATVGGCRVEKLVVPAENITLKCSAGGSCWLLTGCSFWYVEDIEAYWDQIRADKVGLGSWLVNSNHGRPPSTTKSSMIRCRLLSPYCFSALNHFWSPSAQQVCLECSFWLCTCPENHSCLVMLHYHFIAWRMCRSQRVQESVLELLEFCIWWVLRWGGRRAQFTSIWFTELLSAGSHNNIHWWIEGMYKLIWL